MGGPVHWFRRILTLSAATLLCLQPAGSQIPRSGNGQEQRHSITFEIAAIRPNRTGDLRSSVYFTPTGLSITGFELAGILDLAFPNVPHANSEDLITGIPSWARRERYDIQAKVSEDQIANWQRLKMDEQKHALLALLIDRFRMRFHREVKTRSVYVLRRIEESTSARRTAKIHRTLSDRKPHMFLTAESGHLESNSTYMWQLVDELERQLGCIVLDRTELQGAYDYTLRWTPDNSSIAESSGPSLATALKEQLGIELTYEKMPMEVVVVDHLERPSSN